MTQGKGKSKEGNSTKRMNTYYFHEIFPQCMKAFIKRLPPNFASITEKIQTN